MSAITTMQVSFAEDIASRLEEALYHMRSAIEELEGAPGSSCVDLVSSLTELVFTAENEKQKHDHTIEAAEQAEIHEMNRAFERGLL